MQAKQIIHQRPCPRIYILSPDSKVDTSGDVSNVAKLKFDLSNISSLQSFNFSLSTDDITGSFNLLFFPEHNGEPLFDKIDLLDIVLIYEDYPAAERLAERSVIIRQTYPIFTGIIRSKKYAATGGDSGVMRRMSVSGTAITGLVSQFRLSLEVTAQATGDLQEANQSLQKALAAQNSKETKIKDVILNIWDGFLTLSKKHGTPTIAEYIAKWMGEPADFFDIEDLPMGYPIAALFTEETTHEFFNIADLVLPPPYYEKSAYTDSKGKMKIRMRKCPFDASDWNALSQNKVAIDSLRVKSFDVTQSDNEVYTIFLAYLEGSAISEQKYLITSLYDAKQSGELKYDEDKYGKYGYRPLFIKYRGYKPPDSESERSDVESSVSDTMAAATEQIKGWFGNLDKMLSGSITLAMTYNNDTNRIMPGDVVGFLGGEFYVDGISHSWTYNGGGEINISVSRGGIYSEGAWSPFTSNTGKSKEVSSATDSETATSEATDSPVQIDEAMMALVRGLNRGCI